MRDSKSAVNKIALSIADDNLDDLVALVGDNLDMSIATGRQEYAQPLITLAIEAV